MKKKEKFKDEKLGIKYVRGTISICNSASIQC